MAPHIVSWGANTPAISPASSSSPSVVSFESISSSTEPFKSPEAHDTDPASPNTSLIPASTYPGLDDSFLQHDTYFFKDGNITFLVDGTLYCVHRFFFSRDSVYFSTRLAQIGTRDHEALTTVVSLGDVEREDFEALLSVIYPKDFEEHNLSYQQWKSVLHLSTRWSFASIRKLALRCINPPTPHDRLVLARTYAVDQWVLPALTALCERAEPLNLTEARPMRIEDVVLVAAVREEVRSRALRVDAGRVTRFVEAALAGKLPRSEGDGTSPEGGAIKQGTAAASPAQNKYFTQWEGKTGPVTKLPEENVAQGFGNATQAAPKREGERDPKPIRGAFGLPPTVAGFSFSPGNGAQGPFGVSSKVSSAEKISTSKPLFSFGSPPAAPSPSSSTPLRPVETDPPSPEPAAKKPRVPEVGPADSRAPATRK